MMAPLFYREKEACFMKKIWRTFCMVCLMLIVLCSFPLMTSAESSDIAGGIVHTSRGEVTWAIDKTGKLILTGSGEVSLQDGEKRVPWYDYRDQIFSAEIKTTNTMIWPATAAMATTLIPSTA